MSAGTVSTERSSRRPSWRTVRDRHALSPARPEPAADGPPARLPAAPARGHLVPGVHPQAAVQPAETVYNGVDNYRAIIDAGVRPGAGPHARVIWSPWSSGRWSSGRSIALLLTAAQQVHADAGLVGLLFAWATPPLAATVGVEVDVQQPVRHHHLAASAFVGIDLRGDNSVLFSGRRCSSRHADRDLAGDPVRGAHPLRRADPGPQGAVRGRRDGRRRLLALLHPGHACRCSSRSSCCSSRCRSSGTSGCSARSGSSTGAGRTARAC